MLFAGDILFIGGHPVMWAGPVGNWIAALDRILALDPRAIVPGHGPLTDRAGVEHLRRYFEHVTEEARARHAKGMTALEAARDMPMDEYPTWDEAERLVVNVATIYREIEGDTAQPDPVTSFTQMAELASGTLPQP